MIPICKGLKRSGQPCTFKGRHGDGFCKRHLPKKSAPDCPICYEPVTSDNRSVTRCNHEFHRSCLDRWTAENPNCPMCRHDLAPVPAPSPPEPLADPVALRAGISDLRNALFTIEQLLDAFEAVNAGAPPRRMIDEILARNFF